MAEKAHLQTLFAYDLDITDRMIDRAGVLSAADYDPLHHILFHLLRASYAWRLALTTGQQPKPLEAEGFPTREALAAGFAQERRGWDALLEGLSDAEIAAEMTITRANGQQMPLPRWRVLHQVLLHGMQHHAELAQLLTEKGHSPGDIDFIFHR